MFRLKGRKKFKIKLEVMTLFKMARNFTSISEIKFQLREIHTGNRASVATPSNSSRSPDTDQTLTLPCAFRLATGLKPVPFWANFGFANLVREVR